MNNYEHKYKEALERARIWQNHLYDTNDRDYADELNYIFPELAESEDERIKKEIIDFLELPHSQFIGKRDHEKWIAWLEKQSKKLDANKVIEWIKTHGNLYPIVTIKINDVITKFEEDFGL